MTEQPRLSVLIYRTASQASPERQTRESADSPQALNRAARDAGGEFLALVPVGARLPEGLTERCVAALEKFPATQAVYPAHTAGDAAFQPFVTQTAFRPATLMRRNAVGPVAVIRRAAWEQLGGLRTGLSISMALWDFWLRLALAHPAPDSIRRLPAPLAQCPARGALCHNADAGADARDDTRDDAGDDARDDARDDGRAKALLVVHTPGAFENDVCRWAMALLRGEAWARSHAPGLIPTAAEVRRMWESGRMAARISALRQSA